MDITYLGHSCFKLAGKSGTVVTDPYGDYVGFAMPKVSADVVTVSHDHPDHNAVQKVTGTARREKPFIISQLGEYEVQNISVFGVQAYHDGHQGSERGISTIFTILIDGLRICHLGDLGHELTSDQVADIGAVDVVLCPVGGTFTIDPVVAVKTINVLEPSIVIPMHYRTPQHDLNVFADLKTVEDFFKEYGSNPAPIAKLSLDKNRLPEETELVVLQ